MKRNRSEFFFFLVSVLLLGLVIGNLLSGYVTAQTGSAYSDLEIFSDAISIIQSDYVEEMPTKELIYSAMKGMMDGLDPHSQFMPPDIYKELKVETEGHFGGLGIVISLDENKVLTVVSPIEDTPAFKAGVQAGDRVIKIDGEPTTGLVLEEAVKKLRGPKGSKVTITILRLHENDGKMPEELEFTMIRDDIKIRSVNWEMLDEKIARIRLREFSEQTATELHKALEELKKKGMRSLVLDLRSNPGGLLNVAAEVADEFLDKGQLIVYTESRDSDQNMKFNAKRNPSIEPSTPIVILVNEGSASASEIVAGALRDWNRAVVLGTKTFGKGSVQSIIPLSDGSALRLTTAKYLTPNGHSIDRLGIIPDIEVKMSKEQLVALLSREGSVPMVRMPPQPDTPSDDAEQQQKDEEEIADVQLQRAVDLLRGYDIFKSLEQNINLAKGEAESAVKEDAGTAVPEEAPVQQPEEPVQELQESLPEIMLPHEEQAPVPEGSPGVE
ncbi:MAG: S41 family peptidase [Candidatus Abyssobacteria bacterium SURF_17]|uniref:S41 family peptidase n=1 Tax=Candidatus Abyssobacteria bacterium SURF_17 TaxID=2093361 RepID=A0A419ESU6_9BACT|nr:MAG: S41 family peptidase [Candidatus Abyssubacteria bacterium SURF_17]